MSLPPSRHHPPGRDRARDDRLASAISHGEWWDAIVLNGPYHYPTNNYSMRMFGNANVGNMYLTNLQVAGGLIANDDFSVLVRRWFLRTNIAIHPSPGFHEAWTKFLNGLMATLVIGNRITWQANGLQLWQNSEQPNNANWPLFIPPRQNVSVTLDRFTEARDHFVGRLPSGDVPDVIWIHLQGLLVPAEIAQRVVRKLTELEGQVKSTEDRVVDWIRRTAETSDDAGKLQLEAICDGILEGRHMGGR
jgi:hypothetical protein